MNETRNGPAEGLVGLLAIAMGLLMLGAFLIFVFGLGNIPGQEPSRARSIFFVVNAATLTGFELTTSVTEYKPLGQLTIFVLILAGALLSLVLGGWALTRILNMPYTDGQVVRAAGFELLLVLLGAGLLLGPLQAWPAIFQATSALSNAGHVLGPSLGFHDRQTHLILLPLAIIGGLGVPVLLDLSSSIKLGHRLHSHTRSVLMLTAGIYVVAALLIAGLEWTGSTEFERLWYGTVEPAPSDDGLPELRRSLIVGSTEAINSRTLGMSFGAFQLLCPASQWVIVLLMLIGGSPGSTAGGLKNTTLLVLVRDSWNLWAGRPVGRLFGLAVIWTVLYMVVILITTILLAIAQPQLPGERMVLLAVSAITNTGMSHSPLSLPPLAMYALVGAMLFGRFVPLAILWYAARDTMPLGVRQEENPWPPKRS